MTKPRIFISFDFDNDSDLKELLVGQSKNENSPFEIADWSLKDSLSGDWKEKIKPRIKSCHQVIVICGEKTDKAPGIDHELEVAQEEEKPYFLLYGRGGKTCKKPKTAKAGDKMYKWTWDNLKSLIKGNR
ncbi:TIR domain-containing protein [Nanoarchaeota archaeon]